MAYNFGKGIKVTSGFDLSAKGPIDNRTICDTIAQRDAHSTAGRAYEGLSVVNNGKITMKFNNTDIKDLDPHNLGLKYYNSFKKSDKEPKFYETKDYSLFIGLSNKFNQFSYVNGINTYEGGSHVNNILKQLTKGIITLAKSDKENEVKNNLFLLLSIKMQNPVFSSQSKEKLTSRNGLTKILKLSDERIKDIEAELEWYKVKYHEMKMNVGT